MADIKIRRAERGDCPRIIELVRELAEYERAPEEITVSPEHFEESGFGPNPVWWAFVAESEEGICAFALYYVRFSTWKGQRMYLEDIYVTPEMRRHKVGSMLFDRLIVEARERGLNGLVWQVLQWNQSAVDFYRKYNARIDGEWINCSIDF